MTGNDGYRWLRYADEIKRGVYLPSSADRLSGSPEPAITPPVYPLLSVMIYKLSDITGRSYEESSGLITVFLSCLFVFPLGAYLWLEGLPAAAVGASVTGSLCFAYLSRTAAFTGDTDILNLFFPLLIILFIKLAARRPYIFSALAGLACYVHYQWYFHSGFMAVWLVMLVICLVSAGKSLKTVLVSAVVFIVCAGYFQLYNAAASVAELFTRNQQVFAVLVAENFVPGFKDGLRLIAPFYPVALIGLILSLAAVWRARLLAPLLLLGLLMFFKGERFGMYLGLFAGLGTGFIFDILMRGKQLNKMLGQTLILFISLVLMRPYTGFTPAPYVSADTFRAIASLPLKDGSQVITHWDLGFIMEYLKRVRCAADGASMYKTGGRLAENLFSAEGCPDGIIREIYPEGEVFIVENGSEGSEYVKNGYFSAIKTKKNLLGMPAPEKTLPGGLNAGYDDGSGYVFVYSNKTKNSFFGKTLIIGSHNVYCIQQVMRNFPLIAVYRMSDQLCRP